MIKGSLSTRIAKLIPVYTGTNKDDGATCCEDTTKKEYLGTGTGPSSASESDGTKVTLGMMLTALSALAVVYVVTNIL
jgi:hypothetical protein